MYWNGCTKAIFNPKLRQQFSIQNAIIFEWIANFWQRLGDCYWRRLLFVDRLICVQDTWFVLCAVRAARISPKCTAIFHELQSAAFIYSVGLFVKLRQYKSSVPNTSYITYVTYIMKINVNEFCGTDFCNAVRMW